MVIQLMGLQLLETSEIATTTKKKRDDYKYRNWVIDCQEKLALRLDLRKKQHPFGWSCVRGTEMGDNRARLNGGLVRWIDWSNVWCWWNLNDFDPTQDKLNQSPRRSLTAVMKMTSKSRSFKNFDWLWQIKTNAPSQRRRVTASNSVCGAIYVQF